MQTWRHHKDTGPEEPDAGPAGRSILMRGCAESLGSAPKCKHSGRMCPISLLVRSAWRVRAAAEDQDPAWGLNAAMILGCSH